MLVESLAAEMVAAGITPGTAMFEPFQQMQIGVLIQRVRGICQEHGIVIEEPEAAPAPRRWWKFWG